MEISNLEEEHENEKRLLLEDYKLKEVSKSTKRVLTVISIQILHTIIQKRSKFDYYNEF